MKFKGDSYLKLYPRKNIEQIKKIEKIKEESAISLTDEEVKEIEKTNENTEDKGEVSEDGTC